MQTCREGGERDSSYVCVCVLWHFLEFLSSPRFAACVVAVVVATLRFVSAAIKLRTHTQTGRHNQCVRVCGVYLLCAHTPPTCCTAVASHMSLRFHCQYCAYAVLSFLSFIFLYFRIIILFFYCFLLYLYYALKQRNALALALALIFTLCNNGNAQRLSVYVVNRKQRGRVDQLLSCWREIVGESVTQIGRTLLLLLIQFEDEF